MKNLINRALVAEKRLFIFLAAVMMAATMSSNAFAADSKAGKTSKKEAGQVQNEFTNWHRWLDFIHIDRTLSIEDYTTIYLRPIDVSAIQWPDKTDNQYKGLKSALEALPDIVKTNIEKKYKHLNVVILKNEKAVKADDKALILRLKIDELDMGNRALRVWVGFGAGHQSVAISGEVTDTKNKSFFNFRHRRLSSSMVTYEKILKKEFKNFSKDICRIFKEIQK